MVGLKFNPNQPQPKKKLYQRILDILKPSIAITDNEFNSEESNPYDPNEKDSDADIEDDGLIFDDLFGDC